MSAVAVGVVVGGVGSVAESSAEPVAALPSRAVDADLGLRVEDSSRGELRPALVDGVEAPQSAGHLDVELRQERRVITAYNAKLAAEARAEARKKAAAKRKALAERKRKAAARKRAELARIKAQGYEPGTTDPREIAKQILKNKYGYGGNQYQCFNNIIMRESEWNIHATNASSGAYGIPQALPGSKMASVGADWRTNPATQITWGIEYMKDTYGSPCGAWGFKSSHGWY